MPSHKICIPLTGAIHCCTPSKAVNILHHACRAKATLAKWYQCFAAPAIIHAMPERLANKRFRVDFISTAELAPAFAALPLASKWSNYRENAFLIGRFWLLWKTFVRMCESVKRSSVLEYNLDQSSSRLTVTIVGEMARRGWDWLWVRWPTIEQL